MSVSIRLVETKDAAALAQLQVRNRAHLEPWEPARPDIFFTEQGQQEKIHQLLEAHAAGGALPMVVVEAAGTIVGQVMLNSIIGGAFQSASLAYWISWDHLGKGYATRAVELLLARAFTDLGLHRVQAEVLPHNASSLRVLAKSGFVQYGLAPTYLKIAGRWQDHALLQLINDPAD